MGKPGKGKECVSPTAETLGDDFMKDSGLCVSNKPGLLPRRRPREARHLLLPGVLPLALGGSIGLGGAEFRLPLLIGAFRFAALQA